MEQILRNMALIQLNEFCTKHGIDQSGTYIVKNGRGFTYSLRDQQTDQNEIAAIMFHKSQVPTFRYSPEQIRS